MALLNLSEISSYIRNLYDRVGLDDLREGHAARIREWFIANMSNIGRYSNRDFERFGSLNTADPSDPNVAQRQDGWQAVTEEVPDIDHITYGTGILYIHGEMEIPSTEDNPGNAIVGDEFAPTSREADASTIAGQHFLVATTSQKGTFNETQDGSDVIQGYKWNFSSDTPTGDGDESGHWWYDTIIRSGSSPTKTSSYKETSTKRNAEAAATSTTPSEFNDATIYGLDNERNNYPFIIINSGQPQSINTLLQSLDGDNGMFDGTLPGPVTLNNTYPPQANNGLTISQENRRAILDYISPLNETPSDGNS
jgi:hypothetical protein